MYCYPFYLVTDNASRNRNLAELIATGQKNQLAFKLDLYSSLPEQSQHKGLYDLLELERSLTGSLCDVLRVDYSVLGANLPKIDHWRVEEKAKQVLSTIRAVARAMPQHHNDITKLLSTGDWGETPLETPGRWNDLILMRVADMHRHVALFVENANITLLTGQNADENALVVKVLEGWRTIAREIKEFTRLVASL